MGSSYTNINIHLIFHTKCKGCEMKESDLSRIFHYLGRLVRAHSSHVYMVGGRPDHIHILFSLPITMAVSDFVRKIKSNSSKWIKGLGSEYNDFEWQNGYGAFSVSASNVESVINYISQQKEHHRIRSAQDEFLLFLEKNGFSAKVP